MAASEQHDASAEITRDDNSPFRLGYRRWLDGLRGIAILAVLAFHFHLLPGGSVGVDVFFVLSGFLITTLLAEEWQRHGSISLRRFYLRRVLRLWPAFAILLAIAVTAGILHGEPGWKSEALVAGCYIANWPSLHHTPLPRLGPTWSLSVEEQFYLVWPLALWIMLRLRMSRRAILMAVVAGILASATLRATLYAQHRVPGPEKQENIMRLYMGSDTRADALLVGCLVGLLAVWGLLPRSQRFIAFAGKASLVGAVLLAFCAEFRCLDHSQYYHGLFTVVAAMVGIIIVRFLLAPPGIATALLESAPLVWIGRLSYGLYLYHTPIMHELRPGGLGWHEMGWTALVAGLTLAAALASYFCIERPFLLLKDRFKSPSRATSSEAILPRDTLKRAA